MGGISVVVLGVIAGVVVLGLLALAWQRRVDPQVRSARSRTRPAEQPRAEPASEVRPLRQSILDRATTAGLRVPVARSGHNPMVVTYTVGPPVHFFTSLDAYRRDLDARRVDPDYASWGRTAPLLVEEWSGDQCREWLADNA